MKSNLYNTIEVFHKLATMSIERARQILNVPEGMSPEEINKQYKKQMKEIHPDKLHHLPVEARKAFEALALELNLARDLLLSQPARMTSDQYKERSKSYEQYLQDIQNKTKVEREWQSFLNGITFFNELRYEENIVRAKKMKIDTYG